MFSKFACKRGKNAEVKLKNKAMTSLCPDSKTLDLDEFVYPIQIKLRSDRMTKICSFQMPYPIERKRFCLSLLRGYAKQGCVSQPCRSKEVEWGNKGIKGAKKLLHPMSPRLICILMKIVH